MDDVWFDEFFVRYWWYIVVKFEMVGRMLSGLVKELVDIFLYFCIRYSYKLSNLIWLFWLFGFFMWNDVFFVSCCCINGFLMVFSDSLFLDIV